jgi:hypothetical protein
MQTSWRFAVAVRVQNMILEDEREFQRALLRFSVAEELLDRLGPPRRLIRGGVLSVYMRGEWLAFTLPLCDFRPCFLVGVDDGSCPRGPSWYVEMRVGWRGREGSVPPQRTKVRKSAVHGT